MLSFSRVLTRLVVPTVVLAAPGAVGAQQAVDAQLTTEAFARPPAEIAEAVLAPRHLNVTLGNPSPDGRFFLNERGNGPPSMAMFAKPFYRIGGLQVDWAANRDRRLTTRSAVEILVTGAGTGDVSMIQVPDGARVSAATWSPDGARIGFLAHFDDASYVYVADRSSGRSRRVARSPVLATLHTAIAWTPDGRSIVTVLLPENRGAPPVAPAVPAGPQVRLTTPETNRIRTYPDLLHGPHERALLEYYATGQLAVIDVERRRARRLGAPAMISGVDVSPDGLHVRVTTMRGPFSYIVPVRQFASAQEIWSLETGRVLALVLEQAVRDGAPSDTAAGGGSGFGGASAARRNIAWRPDGALGFAEAAPRRTRNGDSTEAPQGEPGRRSRRGDRVMRWAAPFDSSALSVVYENTTRLQGVGYAEDGQTLFLTERQGDNTHEFAVRLSDPETKHTLWRGERPGGFFGRGVGPTLVAKTLANGASVVRTAPGGEVFLSGTDFAADPRVEGPTSYIDRVAIEGDEKERVYESDNDGVFERVLQVLNDDATRLLVTRENPTDVPDSYLRDVAGGNVRQLTNNVDHTPDLTRAVRRRYDITRVDGFEFAAEVTLPENWNGERLPGIVWFYPREYTDQESYDERTRDRYNRNAFPNLRARSMDVLVRMGYAVIEPDAPIIGESGRMNDNYVHDLRNNLAAAIDFFDKEGIIDRERLGVGGHSYGAFSTVNAMVHTPFFKAGIAGDGNFNRTLTPFSFQSERRSLWQARDLYFAVSPIFQANHLSGALLMYHGADDQNVGTFPINSWRLFESLESLGKTASLYMYPYEEHGPATEETLLDLWARWTAWLDKYVKNAAREERTTADTAG